MKKNKLEAPFIGVEDREDFAILYTKKGDYSVIFEIRNTCVEYCCNVDHYNRFHVFYDNLLKLLGDQYIFQKTDIFSLEKYSKEPSDNEMFLTKKYFEYFKGREYFKQKTYLTITKQSEKSFLAYNKAEFSNFELAIGKVIDMFNDSGIYINPLKEREVHEILYRFVSVSFGGNLELDNLVVDNNSLSIGKKKIRLISLVDTDKVELPQEISDYREKKIGDFDIPIDLFSFLRKIPHTSSVVYTQIFWLPNQRKTISQLESKQKRHEALMDPANLFAANDIQDLLEDVARTNDLVIQAHFNIAIISDEGKGQELNQATNYLHQKLFELGIVASNNSNNQLELLLASLPGNAVTLKDYDKYLTTAQAGISLLYKETQEVDEDTDFACYFTSRQGIPLKIDISGKEGKEKLTNNSNKFILGPSGSGKSFFTNGVVRQYLEQNTDVVLVDTGHSYSGLCEYFGGKYITYSDESPITMNPFVITQEEYNLEKKDFLVTLLSLLWKGADGDITITERDLLAEVIDLYYYNYFNKTFQDEKWLNQASMTDLLHYAKMYCVNEDEIEERALEEYTKKSKVETHYDILGVSVSATEDEIKSAFRDKVKIYHPDKVSNSSDSQLFLKISYAKETLLDKSSRKEYDKEIHQIIKYKELKQLGDKEDSFLVNIKKDVVRHYVKDLSTKYSVKELSFNSFYEFALDILPTITTKNRLDFQIDTFKYVLKKFYKGGVFDSILNEDADKSLFDEKFIVFEIDNIKDNAILFPIVTLIIMDVFLQKMRLRQNRRKALIIEEAWKAIANKLMGGYILYLYKTVRKFWGEAVVVTQELDDIVGNEVVKNSIINNSDTIILLDQSKFRDRYDEIAQLLGLSEVEQKKIFTISNLDNKSNRGYFKEVYIKRGEVGRVFGVEESPYSYMTYTTEKIEKEALNKYREKYKDYNTALTRYVEDFKKSGDNYFGFSTKVINDEVEI